MAEKDNLDEISCASAFKDEDYNANMLERLNDFRLKGLFTDITLCVGSEEFPCHKNVLAVSSPYFQAMFTSDLKESRENKISFSAIPPWIMKLVIEYAYSGHIQITANNAQEMLAASCLLQYPSIVAKCEDFLKKQLHPSNCLGIEMFALLHSCTKLAHEANQYTQENFSSVIENDEFLELPLERLKAYISSDHIDVRTEETVLDCVIRWVKSDLAKREKHLPVLLEKVRLSVMEFSSLKVIENNPLVSSSQPSLRLVEDAHKLKHSFQV